MADQIDLTAEANTQLALWLAEQLEGRIQIVDRFRDSRLSIVFLKSS